MTPLNFISSRHFSDFSDFYDRGIHAENICRRLNLITFYTVIFVPENMFFHHRFFLVVHAPFSQITADKIIQLSVTDKPNEKFGFKRYRYVTAEVKLSRNGEKHDLYFDSGCIMNLIKRDFIRQCIPDIKFSKMPTKMTIKKIGNQKHDANEFVIFQIFIPELNNKTVLI